MKKSSEPYVNEDFDKCRRCVFFPDISALSHEYYYDNNGVKHRDIKYICQYDMHEIRANNVNCARRW
jgi:hypothetical protein